MGGALPPYFQGAGPLWPSLADMTGILAPPVVFFYISCMSSTVSNSSQITVNGQPHALRTAMSVRELVAELALDPRQVAVELNRVIIPRSQYDTTAVHSGDAVEVVRFIGGG